MKSDATKRQKPPQMAPVKVGWKAPEREEAASIALLQPETQGLDFESQSSTVPVYVIGDSHSLAWDGLIVKESSVLESSFVFRTTYLGGVTASKFYDQNDQRLHEGVFQSLIFNNLVFRELDRIGVPFHHSTRDNARNTAMGLERPRTDPIIVFTCGDIDVRMEYRSVLKGKTFKLEGDDWWCRPCEEESKREAIPIDEVFSVAAKIVEPLILGIKYLQRLGFKNLWAQTLPPPTLSDEKYFKINPELQLPKALRYRLVHLYNQCLRKACEENHIRCLDNWSSVLNGSDELDEAFEIDGVHLNRKGAAVAAEQLLSFFAANRPPRTPCSASHSHAFAAAKKAVEGLVSPPDDYRENYLTKVSITEDELNDLSKLLKYEHAVNNEMVRVDWTGNPREPFSTTISYAKPNAEILKTIYDIVYLSPVYETIKACLGCDFITYNVRPFQSNPHDDSGQGPQSFHFDGCPEGIIRGILYLVDVDEGTGPFEYKNQNEDSVKVTSPAGTLVIFDATKILHRGNPPRVRSRKVIDFVFAALPPGKKRAVMSASMNNWPVDPYNYSTEGSLSYPK